MIKNVLCLLIHPHIKNNFNKQINKSYKKFQQKIMKSTLKLIAFLTLLCLSLQAGFQCNVANCQYCSYLNMCGQCTTNYILTQNTTNGDFYCNQVICPANCMTCYMNNTCQTCKPNFFVASDSSCSTSQTSSSLPTNCLWSNNSQTCGVCAYGYSLQSGFCFPIIDLSNQDANCVIKMTQSICQICKTNYIVGFLGKCVPNQANTSCTISNCFYCGDTNNTCTVCFNGFQVSPSGGCVSLLCSILGCLECSNSTQCKTCMSGFFIGSVNKNCTPAGYGCDIAGCAICNDSQSCAQCKIGWQLTAYTVGNNTVWLCYNTSCPTNITNCNKCSIQYNTIFQYGQIFCEANSCIPPYINVYGYCVAKLSAAAIPCDPTIVPGCITCAYNNFCSVCSNGYTLTLGGTCQQTICNVVNCASCGINNICQACNSNYKLVGGFLSIIPFTDVFNYAYNIKYRQCIFDSAIICNIPNCAYCFSPGHCFSCATGYDFDAANVNCIKACTIPNCYQCNQGSNSTLQPCNFCNPGYVLSSNSSVCTPIPFSCPSGCNDMNQTMIGNCVYNPATGTGQCLQCSSGMNLYLGRCYSQNCDLFGCISCASWSTPVFCLQCQQSLQNINGYCIKLKCNDSVANCQNCIESGKCIGCKPGYLLQNSTNGTVTCTLAASIASCGVTNCLKCNATNYCMTCASPYIPINGACVCNFQNCLDCSQSALWCNLCPRPLIASPQTPTCVPQPSLSNPCILANCKQCYAPGKCSICTQGYTLNSTDFSCNINVCSSLGQNNCQLCDQLGYQCTFCNTGYMIDNFLEGGSCYPISQNYTCNISGCAVCSSTNNSVCSACLAPFYMSGIYCLPFNCSIANCYICLDNNFCTICDIGYYLSIGLTCMPLSSNYTNCGTSIPYCDMCVIGLYNTDGKNYCVQCQQGFQFNVGSGACLPQSNSISNCKVQLAAGSIPSCLICTQGYFVNTWGTCSAYSPQITNPGCSVYNCLYCAQNSTTCSFCLKPWGISSNGLCQTNDSSICGSNANCLQCANSTYCVTCISNYLPYLGNCIACNIAGCSQCQTANACTQCQSTYTISGSTCFACNISFCQSCSANNVCQTCNNNGNIALSPSSIGSTCVQCSSLTNCVSCSADNMCGVCMNNYQLYVNSAANTATCITCNVANCISCTNNDICGSCAIGYSNAANGACITCSYPCVTCTSTGSCATCSNPYYILTPSSNGTCFAATVSNCLSYNATNSTMCLGCATSYTLNTTNNTCNFLCNTVCATCSGSNSSQCLTCPAGTLFANNTCTLCATGCSSCNATVCLGCLDGFYLITGECKNCPGYCSTCTSFSVCTKLVQSNNQVLIQQNGVSVLAICAQSCTTCSSSNPQICIQCANGFYLSSGMCSQCSINCQTCSNTNPATCQTCYANSYLSGTSCVTCTPTCQACVSATQNNLCTSCYPGYHLINQTCVIGCPVNCLTCSSSTVCISCASGYTLFNQGNSTICVPCVTSCRSCAQNTPTSCIKCGDGFYLSGSNCVACSINCQLCTDNGVCTSCIFGFFLTSSQTCSPNCILPCSTCSSNNPTKCTACIAGYTFLSTSFSCSQLLSCNGACSACPIGYALVNGQCSICTITNCQTCKPTLTSVCTSCVNGYYLNSAASCLACDSSCATCLTANGCLTCSTGFTTLAGVNAGPLGYQCMPCVSPCATCYSAVNYCTSCIPGYTFAGWKCTQNFKFQFGLTLLTDAATFNRNYFTFITALSNSIGTSNTNIVSITSITFGSVIISGNAAPTVSSGTQQSNQQFSNLVGTLSVNSNIAGMKIGSSSVTVVNGSIDYDSVNLALILGICIPVGVLLIVGISLYIYCKKKRSSETIQQRIKEDTGFTVRQSFELSANYKEADSARPFEETTTIN